MPFLYMIEDHPIFSTRVAHLLDRANERGDMLFISCLALGEVVAGANKSPNPATRMAMRSTQDSIGFSCLPFDERAMAPFGRLRSQSRLKIADSINLACAAAAGIDLFLKGDSQLVGRYVPGIQCIEVFNTKMI